MPNPDYRAQHSMHWIVAAPAQKFLNRAQNLFPDGLPVDVALGKQCVRPHGGLHRRLVPVPVDEQLGSLPNVFLFAHRLDRRQPAAWASASEQNQCSPFEVSIRVCS